jgi:hypothetical protein
MPKSEVLPVWSEREAPTTYHIDQHEPGRDYATLPEGDETNTDYLNYINSYKEPLHDSIRTVHPLTVQRLDQRNINLQKIAEIAGQITGRPTYPIERIFCANDLRSDPEYKAAIAGEFIPKTMSFGESGISYGEFEFILHFIRLRQTYVNRAPKLDVVDTIAHEIGHANLAHVAYVHLERLETGNKVYHWFGYSWRYNDRYYGELLDEASSAKVAAVTRRELGFITEPTGSIADMYREKRKFSYASVGAIALDILNKAAGHTDELGIYRPLWHFMVNLQDESAREELAAMIQRASHNQFSLEILEAAEYSDSGLPLATLRRVEEACEVPSNERPSKLLAKVGIN